MNSNFSPLKTSSPNLRNDNSNTDNQHLSPRSMNSSRARNRNGKVNSQSACTNKRNNSSVVYDLPEKRHLRILSVNCQRITNKKAEFEAAINYIKPDIICGTESWLNSNIKSSEVFPTNFTVYRKDRSRLGGGVFLLIRNELISTEEKDLTAECESVWARIKLQNSKDLIVGSFYMPHRNKKDISELEKILSVLSNKPNQKHSILTGDFNCPDICWDTGTVRPSAPERNIQQDLVDITTNANLTQMHTESTREKALLDLVFTSNPTLLRNSISVPGIADHDMIVSDIDTKPVFV